MSPENRAYVARRVLLLFPLLVGLTLIMFTMIHVAPGDPALAFVSEDSLDPQIIAQVRKNLGLDQPLPVQYAIWISHVARLDFGTAYTFNQKPVMELIQERLPATLVLQSLALALSLVVAIPIGVVSAQKKYSIIDNVATTGAFLGLAMPNFWIALMLQFNRPASRAGRGTGQAAARGRRTRRTPRRRRARARRGVRGTPWWTA